MTARVFVFVSVLCLVIKLLTSLCVFNFKYCLRYRYLHLTIYFALFWLSRFLWLNAMYLIYSCIDQIHPCTFSGRSFLSRTSIEPSACALLAVHDTRSAATRRRRCHHPNENRNRFCYYSSEIRSGLFDGKALQHGEVRVSKYNKSVLLNSLLAFLLI